MNETEGQNPTQLEEVKSEVGAELQPQLPPQPQAQPPPAHLAFIEDVVKVIPRESFTQGYRITPQGLFVEQAMRQDIVDRYHTWLKQKGASEVKDEKLPRRLFGSDTPAQFYLPEGKRCLMGIFVQCEMKDPMRYRVSYYLGSPTAASDYLHPSDPLFSEVSGLRSVSGKNGLELKVDVKGKEVSFTLEMVRLFARLAENSININKHYPHLKDSLAETARALILTLRKARIVRLDEEPLRPIRFLKDGDNIRVLSRSGFYFYFNPQKTLIGLYNGFGRNLHTFIRDEMAISVAKEERGRVGSFEIFNRNHEFMGSLLVRGRPKMIHGRTFPHFVKESLDSPNLLKKHTGPRTVRTFIEPFINAIQLAEQIQPQKVAAFLSPKYQHGVIVAAYDMWILLQQNAELSLIV